MRGEPKVKDFLKKWRKSAMEEWRDVYAEPAPSAEECEEVRGVREMGTEVRGVDDEKKFTNELDDWAGWILCFDTMKRDSSCDADVTVGEEIRLPVMSWPFEGSEKFKLRFDCDVTDEPRCSSLVPGAEYGIMFESEMYDELVMLLDEDGSEFFADPADIWLSLSRCGWISCRSSGLGVSASSGTTSTVVSTLPGASACGEDAPGDGRLVLWGETPSKEIVVVIVPL